ncbi:MAG TPA: hypothetical protein VNL35_16695 [Chloroflexota bacterium]|nr:hypothetical protein [Chloroflexota bacterium]
MKSINRTLRISDAITRYQRRWDLTPAEVATELETSEDGLARLHRWSILDFDDRPVRDVIDELAEITGCRDTEGLAVILLEAVEIDHA